MSNVPAKLYYVYSTWKINDIIEFIRQFFPDYNKEFFDKLIGPTRIEYYRRQVTERTLCLFRPEIYQRLHKEGFHQRMFSYDFRIQPYEIRDTNKPEPGSSSNLYIPLPYTLDRELCYSDLTTKLEKLEEYGILNSSDYHLTFPTPIKSFDRPTGSAFVEFNNNVGIETRAVIKLVLHDTLWKVPNDREYRVKCLWARNRDPYRTYESAPNIINYSSLFLTEPQLTSVDGSV